MLISELIKFNVSSSHALGLGSAGLSRAGTSLGTENTFSQSVLDEWFTVDQEMQRISRSALGAQPTPSKSYLHIFIYPC
jgi:hypothetical protein